MEVSTDRRIRHVVMLTAIVLVAVTCFRVANAAGVFGLPASKKGYKVGETVDFSEQLVIPAKSTVIVVARSTCSACQAAKPQMKKIAEMVTRRPGTRIEMLAVLGLQEDEVKMADEIGVGRENMRGFIGHSETKLRAVPTIIVVDSSRKILYVHEGKPDAPELEKIQQVLDRK